MSFLCFISHLVAVRVHTLAVHLQMFGRTNYCHHLQTCCHEMRSAKVAGLDVLCVFMFAIHSKLKGSKSVN